MAVKIRPIVLKDAANYRRCWDAIARERRYFFEFKAAPLSEVRTYLRKTLRQKNPFLVAVDGEQIVGYAVVSRFDVPALRHNGKFGIGLLPAYRDMGLGGKLMSGVLKMSRGKYGYLYLEVFGKNKRAQKLYKKMGFERCGRIKNGVKLTYGLDDMVIMQKQMRR